MYSYETQKQFIFTEAGILSLLNIQETFLSSVNGEWLSIDDMPYVRGTSFDMLACLDFLREKGKIIYNKNGSESRNYWTMRWVF